MRQSCSDLTAQQKQAAEAEASQGRVSADNMKGSRSFDNSKVTGPEFSISPQERPQSNMSYVRDVNDSRQIKSELCSPDRLDVEFLPGLPQRPASKLAKERLVTARFRLGNDPNLGQVMRQSCQDLTAQEKR